MNNEKKPESQHFNVKLEDVRLSYPQLFTPRVQKDAKPGAKPKYGASFILDKNNPKHVAKIAEIEKVIAAVKADFFGTRPQKGILGVALRKGDEPNKVDVDGYGPDVMFVSTSTTRKPAVVDRDLSPLSEEDPKLYAGCYVNATVRFWFQDNEFGKKVNAELRAVQYWRKGPAFGAEPVDATKEGFEVAEAEEDESPL